VGLGLVDRVDLDGQLVDGTQGFVVGLCTRVVWRPGSRSGRRLIVQVEIDGKVAYPKYRVPTPEVRIVGTLVDLRGFEPLTS
jgi:hypothetical protein